MGSTASAILFWGFTFHDEDENYPTPKYMADDEDTGWEDYFAAANGVPAPDEEFSDESKPKYRAFWEAKSAIVKASPCAVGHHSYEAQMDFVAIKASIIQADWGDPQEASTPEVHAAWRFALLD